MNNVMTKKRSQNNHKTFYYYHNHQKSQNKKKNQPSLNKKSIPQTMNKLKINNNTWSRNPRTFTPNKKNKQIISLISPIDVDQTYSNNKKSKPFNKNKRFIIDITNSPVFKKKTMPTFSNVKSIDSDDEDHQEVQMFPKYNKCLKSKEKEKDQEKEKEKEKRKEKEKQKQIELEIETNLEEFNSYNLDHENKKLNVKNSFQKNTKDEFAAFSFTKKSVSNYEFMQNYLKNFQKMDLKPKRNIIQISPKLCGTQNKMKNQRKKNAHKNRLKYNKIYHRKYDLSKLPQIDLQESRDWVYPTNYPIRNYQLEITKTALFHNTLIVLPTGLGKTLVAAVVMYNYYRWFPTGKLIFLAPTKPLVQQQLQAFLDIMCVVPKTECCEMTGETDSKQRERLWKSKRIFFATPQTIVNDLERQICFAREIVCVVFDEAHHAMGDYDYTRIVSKLLLDTNQFRVVGLTATPGTSEEQIQEVITNCLISKLEVRTEDNFSSHELKEWRYKKTVKVIKVTLKNEKELNHIINVYKPYLSKLLTGLFKKHLISTNKVNEITRGILLANYNTLKRTQKNRKRQLLNHKEYNQYLQTFLLSMSLFYGYKILKDYGVYPFHTFLKRNYNIHTNDLKDYKFEFLKSDVYQDLIREVPKQLKKEIYSHPKIIKLREILKKHFQKNKHRDTRAMIFSSFRDSVIDIKNSLHDLQDVNAMSFIGQATTLTCKGVSQKNQKLIVKQFKKGHYNTLIATCIGEEGLDIGEIDLIICYDSYVDPKRSVQRFGRTGRKRNGKVVILATEGQEEKAYQKNLNKKKLIDQSLINFENFFFYPNNQRMIPRFINPKCRKRKLKKREKKKRKPLKSENADSKKLNVNNNLISNTSTSLKSGAQNGKNKYISSRWKQLSDEIQWYDVSSDLIKIKITKKEKEKEKRKKKRQREREREMKKKKKKKKKKKRQKERLRGMIESKWKTVDGGVYIDNDDDDDDDGSSDNDGGGVKDSDDDNKEDSKKNRKEFEKSKFLSRSDQIIHDIKYKLNKSEQIPKLTLKDSSTISKMRKKYNKTFLFSHSNIYGFLINNTNNNFSNPQNPKKIQSLMRKNDNLSNFNKKRDKYSESDIGGLYKEGKYIEKDKEDGDDVSANDVGKGKWGKKKKIEDNDIDEKRKRKYKSQSNNNLKTEIKQQNKYFKYTHLNKRRVDKQLNIIPNLKINNKKRKEQKLFFTRKIKFENQLNFKKQKKKLDYSKIRSFFKIDNSD
ncbi:fanconi anemia group m protein [Anaeramoeba flamelloides]|uniref:Fanconi anemia group m protein n=1 Tax=Anaeramoeba flamelloides TaxID=1746091 RepID=A0AAV7YQM5_9EUKA|nr:fanconi anemia group m protein [Anaeramoeba flamelloides]